MSARVKDTPMPADFQNVFLPYQVEVGESKHPDIDLKLSFSKEGITPNEKTSSNPNCRISDNGNTVNYSAGTFLGSIRERGESIVGDFQVSTEPPGAFKGVFLASLSYLLSMRGQLLMHVSGVHRGGKTWLFCGASASGKTTIATELAGGGYPICLDRAIISSLPGGRLWAQPTPISDFENTISQTSAFQVDGIFFIHQATTCSLETIEVFNVPGLIFKNLLSPVRRASWDTMLLETIDDIAARNICHSLGFSRDESFWRLIDSRLT